MRRLNSRPAGLCQNLTVTEAADDPATGPARGVRCRVWWARLASLRPVHLELLTGAERARREELRRAADRDRFVLGAALLRLAGAAELDARPRELVVDRTCTSCPRRHGKPRLPGSDLHVSVSHSGEVVAVATARTYPVGVDVEQLTSTDYGPLLRHVLAPPEAGTVHSARDFFVYWSRKESALKATGDGLATPMTDLVVAPPSAAPRLLRYGADARPTAAMADLAGAGDGYAAAVTLLGPGPLAVDERDADELLAP